MQFSNDAEETFSRALKFLLVSFSLSCYFSFSISLCFFQRSFKDLVLNFLRLQNKGHVVGGDNVTLVQSGAQPIWRKESTHHIQVRRIQG